MQPKIDTENRNITITVNTVIFHVLSSFIISLLVSIPSYYLLWKHYSILFHTGIELLCIFVSISMAIIIWHAQDISTSSFTVQTLGYGFIYVSFYDIIHTYYFSVNQNNLATMFWIAARFSEALIFLNLSTRTVKFKWNRRVTLSFVLVSAIVISSLIIHYSEILPLLLINGAVTPIKAFLECVIIIIFLMALYNLHKKIRCNKVLSFKYIFIAVLIAVPTEICFILYRSIDSYAMVIGHILRLTYYCYLFRGIFIRTIIYPYEKLEQSNKYITDLLNKTPVALVIFSKDFKATYANAHALNYLDCTLDEITGLPDTEIVKKFFSQELYEQSILKEMAESKESLKSFVRTIKNKNGKLLKAKIDVYRLDDGGYKAMFYEAKKAQQLENMQLQMRTLLDTVTNVVIIGGSDERIVMCNKAAEEILGIVERDVQGMDIHELDNMLKFNYPAPSNDEQKNENETVKEVHFTNRNGEKKVLLLHHSRISNMEGEVIGFITIGTEITDNEIKQKKLIQQEKLALLGQMGASIVHETKNYLTTIKGISQLLMLTAKDEQTKTYANKIDNAANEVNRIISDFLTLAKPKPPTLVDISLNELLKSMKSLLETSSFMNGVDVNMSYSVEERLVACDESQIKQVILNITKNAVEAMEGVEHPLLTITTGLIKSQNEMFIEISDTGIGMPKEVLDNLGTPFFTTKEKGTGLGLNVCFQIIKEHGGRIDVISEVGKGTTFRIILPCCHEKQVQLKSLYQVS